MFVFGGGDSGGQLCCLLVVVSHVGGNGIVCVGGMGVMKGRLHRVSSVTAAMYRFRLMVCIAGV